MMSRLEQTPTQAFLLIVCLLFSRLAGAQSLVSDPPRPPVRTAAYQRLIGPLLDVPFHMHYFEDAASDATVTCLYECQPANEPPVAPVARLLGSPRETVPVLIACLDDGRLTRARFEGNTITKPMQVPVGYLCLDMLMTRFFSEPVAVYECGSDGLGACMHVCFYFRPDDYFDCRETACTPRPWVYGVKAHWQRELRTGRLWRAAKRGPESKM